MKIYWLIYLLVFSFKANAKEPKIFDPSPLLIDFPFIDLVYKSTEIDTLKDCNDAFENDSLLILSSNAGIFIFTKLQFKLIKFFKIDSVKVGQVLNHFDCTYWKEIPKFEANTKRDKLLVCTQNGLIFQFNIKNLEIEWLKLNLRNYTRASYNNGGDKILISIGNTKKKMLGRFVTQKYASLVLLDSRNGKTEAFFNDSESADFRFNKGDSTFLAKYYQDIWLWSLKDKKKPLVMYKLADSQIGQPEFINETEFLSVEGSSIYRHRINDNYNSEKIFESPRHISGSIQKLTANKIAVFDYGNIYLMDRKLNVYDSIKLDKYYQDIKKTNSDSIVLLRTLYEQSTTELLFIHFDLIKKEIVSKFSLAELNQRLLLNRKSE